MFRRFLLLAILTWHSTEQLRLTFERSVNVITLFCFNEEGVRINLMANTSVRFYLNRTVVGPSSAMTSLETQVTLEYLQSGTGASFLITPELEGYYSCGTQTEGSSLVTSQPEPLIALPSTDGFPVNGETIYAVQSADGAATIPCPYEPGNLRTCYYGRWTKSNREIASISRPGDFCRSAGEFTSMDVSKYQVDRETFSLIISSVTAQGDNGQYQCQLYVLNPATSSGQTADFRSFPVNLIVDGQPTIMKAPRDVIIGLDPDGEGLTKTATFECTALGRPVPAIDWYYIPVNRDGRLGMSEHLMDNERYDIMNNDSDEDTTRRFPRTSTLTMYVTENDGGIVRCQAGNTYVDAYLTVLSKPFIDIIATLRGEIIYDIGLKVHLSRPVILNITYQDVDSGTHFSRDRQPEEIYNDTSEITYRENRDHVPAGCKNKCHVIVSLAAQLSPGKKVVQGLSVMSSDVIDLGATTPEQTINNLTMGISANERTIDGLTVGISIVGVILVAVLAASVIIIAVICYHQKRQLKSDHKHKEEQLRSDHQRKEEQLKSDHDQKEKQMRSDHKHEKEQISLKQKHKDKITLLEVNNVKEDVDLLVHDKELKSELISRIKDKLKKLENHIKSASIESDNGSDDTPQVDLKQIDEYLEKILSQFKTG